MEFSLKIIVSIVIAIGIVIILTLMLKGQTTEFPAYAESMIPT